MNELHLLQNAADYVGCKVVEHHFDDKRKSIERYFLTHDNVRISPILDYEQMNYFILGMIRQKELTNK